MADLSHLEKPKYSFNGIYRGLVEDNDDELDSGRLKIRVYGVYDSDDIQTKDLPWAFPALNMFWSGGYNLLNDDVKLGSDTVGYYPGANSKVAGSDQSVASFPVPGTNVFAEEKKDPRWNACGTGGQFVVPKKGNIVFVFFEGGNPMQPIYFAMATNARDWRTQKDARDSEIQQKIAQLAEFQKEFKDKESKSKPQTPATGENWADNALVDSKVTIPTMTVQPIISENSNKDIYCITSPNGTTIVIDNSKGNEKLYIIHKNSVDHIDNKGNKKLYIGKSHNKMSTYASETDTNEPCNYEIGVEGDHEIYVAGKYKLYALDDIGIKSQANIQIESAKHVGISVNEGDIDLVVKKGNMTASVNGNLNADIAENANIKITKNANVKIDGIAKVSVKGDVNLTTDANMAVKVAGDMNMSIAGAYKISAASVDIVTPTMKVSGEMNIGGNTKITGSVSASQDVIAGQILYSQIGVDTGGFLRNRGPADIGGPATIHVLQVVGGMGSGSGRPPTPPTDPTQPTEPLPAEKEASSTETSNKKEKENRKNTK